jgi:hypothetical protein
VFGVWLPYVYIVDSFFDCLLDEIFSFVNVYYLFEGYETLILYTHKHTQHISTYICVP